MAIEYFCCFHSYLQKTEKLTDEEVGRLFRALMKYARDGEEPAHAGRESIAFDFIRVDIDVARDRYDGLCETNRRNAERRRAKKPESDGDPAQRPQPTAYDGDPAQRPQPTAYDGDPAQRPQPAACDGSQTKDQTKDQTETKDQASLSCEREKLRPPAREEVIDYCKERASRVNPLRFYEYYAARGWDKVRDWQAALRSWEQNGLDKEAPSPPSYDIQRAEMKARTSVPKLVKRDTR